MLSDTDELILQSLEHDGFSSHVVDQFQVELRANLASQRQGTLRQVFQYARTGEVEVKVSTMSGETHSLMASAWTSVRELKGMIETVSGVPHSHQQLLHEDRVLCDTSTLAAYSISPLRPLVSLVRTDGRKIYCVGGKGIGICPGRGLVYLSSSEVLDPISGLWTLLPSMRTGRTGHAAAMVNHKLYVAGGLGDGDPLDSVEVYDPQTNYWGALPSMDIARAHPGAATIDNKFYVVGGYGAHDDDTSPRTAQYLDTATNVWRVLPSMMLGRWSCAICVLNGRLFAVGGNGDGRSSEVFNPTTLSWTPLPPRTLQSNGWEVVIAGHGQLIVLGLGHVNGGDLCETFDPSIGAWAMLPPMPIPRCGFAAATLGEKLYVFGGDDEYPNAGHTANAFDFGLGTWTELPHMATSRASPAVVECCDKLYVIGGRDNFASPAQDCLNSVDVFDPAAGEWLPHPSMCRARGDHFVAIVG